MKIQNTADLKAAILNLEIKSNLHKEQLTHQFNNIVDSFKPTNLMRAALNRVINPPNFSNKLLNKTIGVAAAIALRRLIFRKKTFLSKIIGRFFEFGFSNIISKALLIFKKYKK